MKAGPERELVARYLDRARAAGKALSLVEFNVIEIPEARAANAATRKAEEARAMKAALPGQAVVIALAERGGSMDSKKLASLIADVRDRNTPAIAFVIGGADGLDPQFVAAADSTLSFSPLTWPHQLVRIMLAEQLYRATAILGGHPYHRGAP